uniref:Ephrin RBD domain-containing protein n=1 Tax=Strongyloides venezuelensis TaxID=75913 RepID=A0A0K0FYE0_STRVS
MCINYSDYAINEINYTGVNSTRECDNDICVYFNGFITYDYFDTFNEQNMSNTFSGTFVNCLKEFEKFIYINKFMRWPKIEHDLKTCHDSKHGFNFRFIDKLDDYYGSFSLRCTKNGYYQKSFVEQSTKPTKYNDYLEEIYVNDNFDKTSSNDESFFGNTTLTDELLDPIETKTNDIEENMFNESFPINHSYDNLDIENSYILPTDDSSDDELLYYQRNQELKNSDFKRIIFNFKNILFIFTLVFLTFLF